MSSFSSRVMDHHFLFSPFFFLSMNSSGDWTRDLTARLTCSVARFRNFSSWDVLPWCPTSLLQLVCVVHIFGLRCLVLLVATLCDISLCVWCRNARLLGYRLSSLFSVFMFLRVCCVVYAHLSTSTLISSTIHFSLSPLSHNMVPFTIGLTFTLPCKKASRSCCCSFRSVGSSIHPFFFILVCEGKKREETKQFKHNKSCVYFPFVLLFLFFVTFCSLSRTSNACSIRFVLSSHPILYINWVRDWVVDSILVCKIATCQMYRRKRKKENMTNSGGDIHFHSGSFFVCFDFLLSKGFFAKSTHHLFSLTSFLLPYLIPYLNPLPPPHISFLPFTYSIPILPAISLAWRKFTPSNFLERWTDFSNLFWENEPTTDWTWSCHLFEFLSTLQVNFQVQAYLSPEKRKKTVKSEISHLARRWTWLDCLCKRDGVGIQMPYDPSPKPLDLGIRFRTVQWKRKRKGTLFHEWCHHYQDYETVDNLTKEDQRRNDKTSNQTHDKRIKETGKQRLNLIFILLLLT